MTGSIVRLVQMTVFALAAVAAAVAQERPRLAVAPIHGDPDGAVTGALRSLAGEDQSVEIIDPDLVRAAVAGSGLAGNLNLSLAQARGLGSALGADFYLLGRLVAERRAAEGGHSYFEWMAGIYLVDGRTGDLLLFQLARAQAESEARAAAAGLEKLRTCWTAFSESLWRGIAAHRAAIDEPVTPVPEVELTDAELTGPSGKLPVFYQRLKPVYTAEADLAGMTATVELEAVFRDDGVVDDIRVVRWAGFGLDQSAVSTVRMLRFKPAERDGKKLTIRGLVRYNFIRPQARDAASPSLKAEEAERLRRSIQRVLNPEMLPVKPPKP